MGQEGQKRNGEHGTMKMKETHLNCRHDYVLDRQAMASDIETLDVTQLPGPPALPLAIAGQERILQQQVARGEERSWGGDAVSRQPSVHRVCAHVWLASLFWIDLSQRSLSL